MKSPQHDDRRVNTRLVLLPLGKFRGFRPFQRVIVEERFEKPQNKPGEWVVWDVRRDE